ncbi:hypothetical protein EVAR_95041_1 [Eumeta japonica]|uniref:Uncharacterized protein n=1 Tax=Eumeta variegata TaxID=151549 RepID=A0A4C1VTK7_EUMVA|nr:hypothetical protein EVAR_95041_1 [Eumeta japonica]
MEIEVRVTIETVILLGRPRPRLGARVGMELSNSTEMYKPASAPALALIRVQRDCFSARSSQCSNFPEILTRFHDNVPSYMAPRATAPLAWPLGRRSLPPLHHAAPPLY